MSPKEKKKEKEKVRDYLRRYPDCTYEKLIAVLGSLSLSKGHFYNIRAALRKSGIIPTGNGSEKVGQKEVGRQLEKPVYGKPALSGTKIEILHTIDASKLTPELRQHWKNFVLPALKEIVPGGEAISLVFLSDPATMEIRRTVK